MVLASGAKALLLTSCASILLPLSTSRGWSVALVRLLGVSCARTSSTTGRRPLSSRRWSVTWLRVRYAGISRDRNRCGCLTRRVVGGAIV